MIHEMIIAGFGGQGVMVMGQLLTYAGMLERKQVSWIPSYGPEMRGGTANCSVIISDEPVGAPIVSEASAVVAMNLPSLEKFEPLLRPGGILLINSALIDREAGRGDIRAYRLAFNVIASELGNSKAANMVALGAVVAATQAVTAQSVLQAFEKMFANRPKLLAINRLALAAGAERLQQ